MTVQLPFPLPPKQPSRPSESVPYLLVNPPLTDPTSPYHSISYLIASTREAGFTGFRALDANADALNHLAEPQQVARLLDLAKDVRIAMETLGARTREDEIRYQYALAGEGLTPDFMRDAINVLRDSTLFYDYPTYRQAVMAVRRWLSLLSLDAVPGIFDGLSLRLQSTINYSTYDDLADEAVIDAIAKPFLPYIEGRFRDALCDQEWELIGFSVNYISQLPIALRLAREARAQKPNAIIVFGGTEICDDVKYADKAADIWKLFPHADIIVAGEGESPLCDILSAIRDHRPLRDIRGAITRNDEAAGAINYENIARLPTPAYDIWDWDSYWSPEPVVLYSPTRGCYWNKCTFCDYGLNTDLPTSPSRDRPVNTVLKDFEEITQISRTVYFAVDAMSPRYLRTLATALAESPVELRWSAELRLERTFPRRDMADLLARSGCQAISFGYESGSQRILDLIDKGVRIDDVPSILNSLADQNIGAQMMGFTGFPSESSAEAAETYEFLQRNRDLWAIAGVGTFGLTPGSIVAKQPVRFGVDIGNAPSNEHIHRSLNWTQSKTSAQAPVGKQGVPYAMRRSIQKCVDGRPFVGGIDSAHSLLYFSAHGRRLLPESTDAEPILKLVEAACVEVPFADLEDLIGVRDIESRYEELQSEGSGASYSKIMAWLRQPGKSRRGKSTAVVLPAGVCAPIPADLIPQGANFRAIEILAKLFGS